MGFPRAIDGEWTIEGMDEVLTEIVELGPRGLSEEEEETCQKRLVRGVREVSLMAGADVDDDDATATPSTSTSGLVRRVCETCCVMMTRTREEERNRKGKTADSVFLGWFEALVRVGSVSKRARRDAIETARRWTRMEDGFSDAVVRGWKEIDEDQEIVGTVLGVMVTVLGGPRGGGTEAKAAARDLAQRASEEALVSVVDACDEESLGEMATNLLQKLEPFDVRCLRAITDRYDSIYARVAQRLLRQLYTEAHGDALYALEQIVNRRVEGDFEKLVMDVIDNTTRLAPADCEITTVRLAPALARLVSDSFAEELLTRSETESKSVLGLRVFGAKINDTTHAVHKGCGVLQNALMDDRLRLRQEAFVIVASLVDRDVRLDTSLMQKAELEAKVDAVLHLQEITKALSRQSSTLFVRESTVQSLLSAWTLILALDVSGKSSRNRDILRNMLRMLATLSEFLTIQAEFARSVEGDSIDISDAMAIDDAKDDVASHVLDALSPVIEVVLNAMLSHADWFSEILTQFEHPEIDDAPGELDAWIQRLLRMHLQLSRSSSQRTESLLSVASCLALCQLCEESDFSAELQRHVNGLATKVMTHVSSHDDAKYSSLLGACAIQTVHLLRDDWFVFDSEIKTDGAYSVRGAAHNLSTLITLCELVSYRAPRRMLLESSNVSALQKLLSSAFTDDELANASKALVSFSKPNLGRGSYNSAGRDAQRFPISGTVALLVTSLRDQLMAVYNECIVPNDWNQIIGSVLQLIRMLLPAAEHENTTTNLAANSVVMLEDIIIQMKDVPVRPTCHIACVVLEFHLNNSHLTDCLRTAAEMLKIAMSYRLDTIPDELEELLRITVDIVSKMASEEEEDDDFSARQEAFISLTSVLVKTGDMLWRNIHTKQRRLDNVEMSFISLATHAFKLCTSAASILIETDGEVKELEFQRRSASLVLAGARLHLTTDKISCLYDVKLLGAFEQNRREFMTLCSGVFANLRALELSKSGQTGLDRGLVAIANALAMDDILPYGENLGRLGESVTVVVDPLSDSMKISSNASSRENSASKPRKRIRNPYLDAVLASEGGAQDEYDDMADFIVCKPGRDYRNVLGLT